MNTPLWLTSYIGKWIIILYCVPALFQYNCWILRTISLEVPTWQITFSKFAFKNDVQFQSYSIIIAYCSKLLKIDHINITCLDRFFNCSPFYLFCYQLFQLKTPFLMSSCMSKGWSTFDMTVRIYITVV